MPAWRSRSAPAIRADDVPRDPHGTVYERNGRGPVVVLVHGLGLSRHMWRWQLPALRARFEVLSYDLQGQGETPAGVGEPSLRTLSAQLSRLLDSCAIARCAVAGFSLGGMVARRFAMDHPERLSALAVLHSAHDRSEAERAAIRLRVEQARAHGPAATVEAALERWFTPRCHAEQPALIAQVRAWVCANDPQAYPALYRILAEGDAEISRSLADVACPVLVMTGAEDHGNSPEMARRMAAVNPRARVVILPGLRHMALAEAPAAFNTPLLAFLREALAV